jgi:hypothetical protein
MAKDTKRTRKKVATGDKIWRENNTSERRPFAPGIEAEIPRPRHHGEDDPDTPRSPGDQPDQKLSGRTRSNGREPQNGRLAGDQRSGSRQEPDLDNR